MSQGGILQDLTTALADVETLTGDTGGVISPDAAHNIDILGGEGIDTAGTANTITISGEDASTTNKGILETATDAEAVAHTVSGVAVVPSNLDNVFAEPPALGGTTPNTGAFTTLVLSGVGAVSALDVVPSSTIAGVTWKGVDVNCAAIDPSASGAVVHGLYVDMTGVAQTNDPELEGIKIEMPSTYSGTLEQCAGWFLGYGRDVEICSGDHNAAILANGEVHINYDATSAAGGEFLTAEDFVLDITGSAGGDLHAMDVAVAGAGSVEVTALGTHEGVEVIHQHIGTFLAPTKAWKYDSGYTDVTTAFGSAGTDVAILASINDVIYVGADAIYDEIEVVLATAANKDLHLTFAYSIAGPSWTSFSPADDTIGFSQNGTIRFESAGLTSWASADVNGTSKYYIRITRTRATAAATTPTEDTIKTLATTKYSWDSSGDLTVNELKPATDLAVQYGGTGTGSLTDHGVLVGSGTSAVTDLTVGTDGQLLVGSSAADPVFATVTAGIGLVTTLGAGTFQIDATGGGLTWTVVTGTTQAAAINNGYICNNAGTRVVATLPDTAAVGSIVRVGGMGAAGWGMAQNASEFCHVGNATTTTGTGGKIESTHENDCIELVCIVADTEWLALSTIGNLTIT